MRISPTARANCPACRGLFPGVFGGGPDVSKKPNKIKPQPSHNTELSDTKAAHSGLGRRAGATPPRNSPLFAAERGPPWKTTFKVVPVVDCSIVAVIPRLGHDYETPIRVVLNNQQLLILQFCHIHILGVSAGAGTQNGERRIP